MLTALPYEASKQHYSSLNTTKQIQNLTSQKMHQFFRPYYQKQIYSLSSYFHIRTGMEFQEIISTPPVADWLDAHRYYIKLCPSQHKEMVQVGVLCYSNVFMHRQDLKGSIIGHALWKFADPQPVFDLYITISSLKVKKLNCYWYQLKNPDGMRSANSSSNFTTDPPRLTLTGPWWFLFLSQMELACPLPIIQRYFSTMTDSTELKKQFALEDFKVLTTKSPYPPEQ